MEGEQRTRTAGRRKRERKEGGKKGNVGGEWSMANMDWSIKLQVIPIIFKWSIRLLHWLDQSWQNEIETGAQKVKRRRKLAFLFHHWSKTQRYSNKKDIKFWLQCKSTIWMKNMLFQLLCQIENRYCFWQKEGWSERQPHVEGGAP